MGRNMHYCNQCDYKTNCCWDVNRHPEKKQPCHALDNDPQRGDWDSKMYKVEIFRVVNHQSGQVPRPWE